MATARAGAQALNAHILHRYEVGRRGSTLCAGHGEFNLKPAPAHLHGQFWGARQVGEFINGNGSASQQLRKGFALSGEVLRIRHAMGGQHHLLRLPLFLLRNSERSVPA